MSSQPGRGPKTLSRLLLAIGAVLVLWTGLLAAVVWQHGTGWPAGQGGPVTAAPGQWIAPLGDLRVDAQNVALTQLGPGGEALMIWRPPAFKAEQFPVVKLQIAHFPLNYVLMLAWKSAGSGESSFTRLQVPRGGAQSYLMSRSPTWTGDIEELGLYLYPQPQTSPPLTLDRPIVLQKLQVGPDTAGSRIGALITSWWAADPWAMMSPSSLGVYPDLNEGLRLTPLVLALLVLALPIIGIALRLAGWRRWLKLVGGGAIAGIMVIHLHWMISLGAQTTATSRLVAGAHSSAERLYDFDLVRLVAAARKQLPPAGTTRVFVASDARFFRLRAGWHLRPHNVFTFLPGADINVDAGQIRPGDYLLTYRRPDLLAAAATGVLTLTRRGLPVSVKLRTADGGLIRFEEEPR